MTAQFALYYFRVARRIVHAVQAQYLKCAQNRKAKRLRERPMAALVFRQCSHVVPSSRLGQHTYRPIPVETCLRAGASQRLNEHGRFRPLALEISLKNEFREVRPCAKWNEKMGDSPGAQNG
jgi:uncharacterized protein YlaI